jgi:predicted nuclease of predicted toxin-antitoxin system
MRLFVDENLGAAFVERLRTAGGLDVIWAVPTFMGWTDDAIAEYVAANQLIVVTEDRGFPEHLLARPEKSFGVILLRLFRLAEPERTKHAIDEILKLPRPMSGRIAVIEPGGTRIVKAKTAH